MKRKIFFNLLAFLLTGSIAFSQSKVEGEWQALDTQKLLLKNDLTFVHTTESKVYNGTYKYIKNSDNSEILTLNYRMGSKEYRIKLVTKTMLNIVSLTSEQELKLKRIIFQDLPDLMDNIKNDGTGKSIIDSEPSINQNSAATEYHQTQPFSLNKDFLSTQETFGFVGFSSSFVIGSFIDYHRSFHDVIEQNATINGSILPSMMATVGIGVKVQLFNGTYFENLHIRSGLLYQKRGFVNSFSSTFNSPLQFSDYTKYSEKYSFHYLSVPMIAMYDKGTWYGMLGLNFDILLFATKKESIKRSQDGSSALENGFNLDDSNSYKIPRSTIKTSHITFVIGAGYNINNSLKSEVDLGLTGNVLKNHAENFSSYTVQVKLLKTINIF